VTTTADPVQFNPLLPRTSKIRADLLSDLIALRG